MLILKILKNDLTKPYFSLDQNISLIIVDYLNSGKYQTQFQLHLNILQIMSFHPYILLSFSYESV